MTKFWNRNEPPRGFSGCGEEVRGLVGDHVLSTTREEGADGTCGFGGACAM